MARAMISLPVPVSPNSRTGALLRDTMSRARHDRGQPGVAANQPLVAGARVAVDQVLRRQPGRRAGGRASFCDI